MTLSPGTRLGPYEIASPLGAGGMGEVFRARDTKLNRDVAIKVLPAAFAQDSERVARFRREAQVLASLNHPNIAAIHGLEESEGVVALALELVEGDDLAERLTRGAIPVDEAVTIAKQIAEGLEAAHERGVVHRDLKPANLKLTRDGTVKILDFGLAKAYGGEAEAAGSGGLSQSPTMSRQMTEVGVIFGTAAYMSPEQARGGTVDRRADIWAFGVVLFEMLTGKRLFTGETVSDTLAAVLRQEIDWKALPASTPPGVLRLLERCLDRDSKRRLRDIGEARVALEQPLGTPDTVHVSLGVRALPWALTLLLALVSALAIAIESGRLEVYVRSFPGPEGNWQVSTAGGVLPTWSRSRRELFYRSEDRRIMVAAYTLEGASFRAEKPRVWSPGLVPLLGIAARTYDLHRDGERVAVLKASGDGAEAGRDHVTVIVNFFDELRRIAPAGGR